MPVGIVSVSLRLVFYFSNTITEKKIKAMWKKKKKHNKTVLLAVSKLNSTEKLN